MRRRKPSGKEARRGLERDAARRGARGTAGRRDRSADPAQRERGPADGRYWIYGHHAVLAALANPRRRLSKLLLTGAAEAELQGEIAAARQRLGDRLAIARATREELSDRLGREAVHQGIAVEVWPLPSPALETVLADASPHATLLVLDQVTDPHNVGAILRSAAAFAATAVIVTQHHSPPETGSLAKAASGGLEQVPLIRVANLAQALQSLKKAGFWCLGLAAEASGPLASANLAGRIALVLGAEGGGLRRLTREQCDLLVSLPTRVGLVQLNVSNAAAIALYERARDQSGGAGEPDPA
jgi:23S rRNA (guanosine2251-2'-O)-methyltransferase